VRVEENNDGQRLDAFLARTLSSDSRNRYKALIKEGHVDVSGRTIVEPNYRVNAGETIRVSRPAPIPPDPLAEDIPLSIIFEDVHLIVVDKPAGLVVHPAAGNWTGTLVNGLIAHCGDSLSGIGGVRRPGIVHRIDKDTSGLLVVAKTDEAHRGLSRQFADHGRTGPLERAYSAVVWGCPTTARGTVDAPLARSRANRVRMAVARTNGKSAITHYTVEKRYLLARDDAPIASLLTCRLETGRTHQIRVHMTHIGHPLIGDFDYGAGYQTKANRLPKRLRDSIGAFARQALHASILAFEHPVSGEILRFSSPLPAQMQEIVDDLGKLNLL
jgi:23S rRNA pseudouridine1911/1915/1917 synthase